MFLSPIFWITAVTTIRAAILILYIQHIPNRSLGISCYIALAVNVAFGASTIMANCLICRPITYRWVSSVKGSCGDQKSLDMYTAILNLVQDFVVVILPMPILWRLKVPLERRVATICLFGMGILYDTPDDHQLPISTSHETLTQVFFARSVCAITIYRVQNTAILRDPKNPHPEDTSCNLALLTSLEALLGIACACSPFLKPVFRKCHVSLPQRWAATTKSFTSGFVPIASRAPRLPYIKQYFNGTTSMTDSSWCEKEVKRQRDKQDSV